MSICAKEFHPEMNIHFLKVEVHFTVGLLVTRFWLLVSGCSFLVARFWLLVTGCSFLVARYWLLVSCYSLLVSDLSALTFQL